ncbi:hypothetical protein D3C85_1510410 [compost metagenome]
MRTHGQLRNVVIVFAIGVSRISIIFLSHIVEGIINYELHSERLLVVHIGVGCFKRKGGVLIVATCGVSRHAAC